MYCWWVKSIFTGIDKFHILICFISYLQHRLTVQGNFLKKYHPKFFLVYKYFVYKYLYEFCFWKMPHFGSCVDFALLHISFVTWIKTAWGPDQWCSQVFSPTYQKCLLLISGSLLKTVHNITGCWPCQCYFWLYIFSLSPAPPTFWHFPFPAAGSEPWYRLILQGGFCQFWKNSGSLA